jgi:hypothetical protein
MFWVIIFMVSLKYFYLVIDRLCTVNFVDINSMLHTFIDQWCVKGSGLVVRGMVIG